MRHPLLFALLFISAYTLQGQGFWFGAKAGPTIAFQKWNTLERSALLTSHYAFFLESHSNNEEASGSLLAQLGVHHRGSAIRFNDLSSGSNFSQKFQFNNASLMLGAKGFLSTDNDPYYLVGIRLEYTFSTNLESFEDANNVYYPVDEWVNKVNYGITVGGGYNFRFSEFVGGFIEFTVQPDLSNQYDQPPLGNVPNPFSPTGTINVGQRQIRNLSFEVSLGIRFLRKVIYVD